jgi:hypothetical protein
MTTELQFEKAFMFSYYVFGWLNAARMNVFVNPVGRYLGFNPLHGFPMGNIDTLVHIISLPRQFQLLQCQSIIADPNTF